jgi:hypothetical protein
VPLKNQTTRGEADTGLGARSFPISFAILQSKSAKKNVQKRPPITQVVLRDLAYISEKVNA